MRWDKTIIRNLNKCSTSEQSSSSSSLSFPRAYFNAISRRSLPRKQPSALTITNNAWDVGILWRLANILFRKNHFFYWQMNKMALIMRIGLNIFIFQNKFMNNMDCHFVPFLMNNIHLFSSVDILRYSTAKVQCPFARTIFSSSIIYSTIPCFPRTACLVEHKMVVKLTYTASQMNGQLNDGRRRRWITWTIIASICNSVVCRSVCAAGALVCMRHRRHYFFSLPAHTTK